MRAAPVAPLPEKANEQHYELPAAFFVQALGARRKYSSCFYPRPDTDLDQAELAALEATAAHADLRDGQRILELGCGWGSLSLHMAETLPGARITGVSNSRPQRDFILAEAARRGLRNLEILTADMNDFAAEGRYDRVVSVEMFEHMRNWPELFRRIRGWLAEDGRVFLHVFAHRERAYTFETEGAGNWMGRHFFTGGIMPTPALIARAAAPHLQVEESWWWGGEHYARTAEHWLQRLDRNRAAIRPILEAAYGRDQEMWRRRWRVFFMACAELFAFDGGREWGVAHARLRT